jgi:RNA polymerase sigma-70 factor (ECF subfamily)
MPDAPSTPPSGAGTPPGITGLLRQWRDGLPEAAEQLFPLIYEDLRRRARAQLARSPSSTLDTTSLVHESFVKLVEQSQLAWNDRCHFFAVASTAMRHILVDHARRRLAQKRGCEREAFTLDEGRLGMAERPAELVALDAALDRLTRLDQRLSRVVELHFFGGLSLDEVGEMLELSARTVKRDWRKARAFLHGAVRVELGI